MIKDDSASHASHAARMVAPGTAGSSGETHFTVHIVSPKFEGLTLVKRQRLVYSVSATADIGTQQPQRPCAGVLPDLRLCKPEWLLPRCLPHAKAW
eukprot:scaffold117974_cov22-Tisochrysis_lutea.AAC.2